MEQHPEITPADLELIDQYLSGTLSPQDREAFDNRLSTDTTWAQKVREIQLLSIGIQETKVDGILKDIHQEKFSQHHSAKVVPMFSWRKITVAAAIVVIVAGAGTWWLVNRQSSETQLFAAYFKPDAGLATTMSTPNNYTFDKAMVDYKTGHYRRAIDSWQSLLTANPQSDTLNYFIGVALIAEKDYQASLNYLDRVIASSNSEFLGDAHWYKGLLLLQLNQREQAAGHIRLSNHPRSTELLKKIQ